jgi:dihydrofolate reductase
MRPFMKTILMMAMTLDGRVARTMTHFPDWTEKEDKTLFAKISKQAGVVIMGSRTFDTLGKPLPGRKNVIMTRQRARKSEWDNLVFTDRPAREILSDLETEGFSEAVLAGGTIINTLFAEAQLIDEVMVTVSPLVFGSGLSLFENHISMEMKLLEMRRIGANTVFLHYKVIETALKMNESSLGPSYRSDIETTIQN